MEIPVTIPDDLLAAVTLIEQAQTLAEPFAPVGSLLRVEMEACLRGARRKVAEFAMVSIEEAR